MQKDMLAPAAALVLWSLLMLGWLVVTRLPALGRFAPRAMEKPGGRGPDLDGVLPDRVNWKAHNYAHLMEQPTLFYATVIVVAIAGPAPLDLALAWGYVGLRVLHSLWQALVNTIPVRFAIFGLGTVCLIVLAVRALLLTL